MIWRRDKAKTNSSDRPSTTEPVDGKGRPTPSRREAEAERKERLKATARGEGAAKARATSGSTAREARNEARRRVLAGDESALSARDRGPERRYARDLVDSRHTVGEYFLYLAIFVLIVGLVRVSEVQIFSQALLVTIVLALIVDSFRIHRSTSRALAEKFPNGNTAGVARYAVMRGMVTRRMRVPKPQVQRGARPGSGRA